MSRRSIFLLLRSSHETKICCCLIGSIFQEQRTLSSCCETHACLHSSRTHTYVHSHMHMHTHTNARTHTELLTEIPIQILNCMQYQTNQYTVILSSIHKQARG